MRKMEGPEERMRRLSDRGFMKPAGRAQKVTKVARVKQEVMKGVNGRLRNGERNVPLPSGGEGDFPLDCPVRIEVDRVMGTFSHPTAGEAEGLMGHVINMDFYSKGVGAGIKVDIKLYRDPNAMQIEVDGDVVFRWRLHEDDLPTGIKAQIAEQVRLDAAVVEQADLEPGDVIEEDEDGALLVVEDDGFIEE